MSTDLMALWGAIQRGDMHAIASHILPKSPSSSDGQHGRKSALSGAQQELSEEGPQAGLGTVEAGSLRYFVVKVERGRFTLYDRVQAEHTWGASKAAFDANPGASSVQVMHEIDKAEFDRFQRRG
jgi:hypothetical protein